MSLDNIVSDEIKLPDFPVFVPSEFNISCTLTIFPLNNYSFGKKDPINADPFNLMSIKTAQDLFILKGFYPPY